MMQVCKWHRSVYKVTQNGQSIVPRPVSGVWRYFLICTSPITHTHFVQTAEPSRVAVRLPSPQRTSLAVISKYTQTTLIPPPCSLSSGILSDLFPGVCIPEYDYGVLHSTIKESLVKRNLQPLASMIKKVLIWIHWLISLRICYLWQKPLLQCVHFKM